MRAPTIRRICRVLPVLVALATGACKTTGGKGQPPVLNIEPAWNLPGTMVVYMPKLVSAAKQQSGDPIYANWADALMSYVDESPYVSRIIDQGQRVSSQKHISSKTVPASDYSILMIGIKGHAVHVMEPWQSVSLFLLLDPYLLGKAKPKNLPPGCEALRVRVPEPKKALTEDPVAAPAAPAAPAGKKAGKSKPAVVPVAAPIGPATKAAAGPP